MVVRIAPSGGRTRRKGGAISLVGSDVPLITPARDPGLNVPLIPISGGEIGSAVGKGLQSFGNVLDQGADLALQVVKRDEGLARDSERTLYSDKLQDTIRDLQKTGDLSDSALVEAAGEAMFQEKERILNEHKGGKQSSAILANRLTQMHNRFADTLAGLNINAADVRLNQTINKTISSITRDVLTDPDVLVSEDPLEAFRFHSGKLEDEIDFLELRPDQARIVRKVGQAEIALSMITPLIKNGQFDRAKILLRSDEMAVVLSPGQQRDAIQRIIDTERTLKAAKSEGQKNIESARVLFPNASEETILEKARELSGLEEENNVDILEVDGKVIAIDKDTLEVSTVMDRPSIEEEAERERAITVAVLSGKAEVVTKMAAAFGLGPIFGEPTASAEQSADPGAQRQTGSPVSGVTSGEDNPEEVVPPLPQEAIVTPFGSEEEGEGELPASSDMQAVIRLQALSRALLVIDETGAANGFLAQARMIIDNSPEIRRSKELDKLITNTDLLAMTGMPIGSTMRDLINKTLPSPDETQARKERSKPISFEDASRNQVPVTYNRGEMEAALAERARLSGESNIPNTPEERARLAAIASKRGAAQVDAEEQLAFVGEAQLQIKTVLAELDIDPTLVGAVGSFRAKGRSFVTLLDDLGMDDLVELMRDLGTAEVTERADNMENFVSLASDAASNAIADPNTGETGFELTLDLFENPTLSALDIIEHSIGVIIARLSTPAGRIPVELIRRSIALVGLKGLRGSQVIIDRLNFVNDRMLQPRVDSIMKRFPELRPEETETPEEQLITPGVEQDIPSGIPEFRLEGGKFVPFDPNAAPIGGMRGFPEPEEIEPESTSSLIERAMTEIERIQDSGDIEGELDKLSNTDEVLLDVIKQMKVFSVHD